MQKPSVSLVIPLFNNAATGSRNLEQCYKILKKTSGKFEIILCDDASRDNTKKVIHEFARKHSGVRALFHKFNLGIAPTLRQLYELAKYDYTVLFSVDGEWDPDDVGKLITKIVSTKADIVVGKRLNKQYTFTRHVVSYFYNLLPRVLFGVDTYDTGSIKVFKTQIFQTMDFVSKSVFFEGEFLIAAQKTNLTIDQIPVQHHKKIIKNKSGVNVQTTSQAFFDLIIFWLRSLQGGIDSHLLIIMLGGLMMIGSSFAYFGLTTPKAVSDDYNLPIAQSIAQGKILTINSANPYMYFPGSSNIILASLLLLHLPVNMFGIVGWLALLVACYQLGKTFELSTRLAVFFAGTFATTISVVRTIADQSIDKWLAVWFIASLILLEKAKPTLRFAVLFGLSFGLLIGSKYSGPLFALPLVIVYSKTLWKNLNLQRLLVLSLAILVSGGFWYLRNWLLKGNPMYPANLPFFPGQPGYTQQDWMLWKIPFLYPPGIVDLFNAFISEYGVWIFAPVALIFLKIQRLKWLGILTFTVSLLLPITTPYKIPLFHIISDMRYIYIPILLSVLATFILAQKYHYTRLLGTLSLLSIIPCFAFVPFYPKILIIVMLILAGQEIKYSQWGN